jgi:hypothetical protein
MKNTVDITSPEPVPAFTSRQFSRRWLFKLCKVFSAGGLRFFYSFIVFFIASLEESAVLQFMKIMKQDGGAEWFWELNLKGGGGALCKRSAELIFCQVFCKFGVLKRNRRVSF